MNKHGSEKVHPGRLTWNLQITHSERKMIFQTFMIMFHVNLQGCNHLPNSQWEFGANPAPVHHPHRMAASMDMASFKDEWPPSSRNKAFKRTLFHARSAWEVPLNVYDSLIFFSWRTSFTSMIGGRWRLHFVMAFCQICGEVSETICSPFWILH